MSNFDTFTLGDVCENISRRFDFANKKQVIFINTGDVKNGNFLHSEYVDKIKLPGQAKKAIKKNDILFSEIRPANKRFAYVKEDSDDVVVSIKFMVIKANEKINPKFLYYSLTNNNALNKFQIEAESRSGTFPQITFDSIAYFPIYIPEIQEQKAIANILSTLDEKIELNQKMNQILEEIAKAIFKSWFIDFDPVKAKAEGRPTGLPQEISDFFPDSFEDSELGEVPKGWNVGTIDEIVSKVAMGPFGSNIKVSTFVNYGVPIISGAQMSSYILKDEENSFITEEHAISLKNSLVYRGDIVITQTGTVGQVSLIPYNSKYKKYIVSSRQHYCRPLKENLVEYIFCFLTSKRGQYEILKNVVTTGVPSISRPTTNLKQIQLTIPNDYLLDVFSNYTKNIFLKIRNLTEMNIVLSDLRDVLLPKLISGELRIKDAEKYIEEAGI